MTSENSKHPEYYEAVLQIRPLNEEVLNFVIGLVEARKGTSISKIDELKTGYDVYISDQKFARSGLVSSLRKKYKNSKVVITKSLYGIHRMKSKLIYRATILFRLDKI
ncbi:hypothetical protein J4216_03360 [Candidatus Woesearchaeota archaeon]|nr:hypothetical protein [Candidatus Woesearchaeota archaeon]